MKDYIKELSLKYKLDKRVVADIVNHPLRFTRTIINSNEVRPIRIKHFGVFAQKKSRNKEYLMRIRVKIMIKNNIPDSIIRRVLKIPDSESINPTLILMLLLENKEYTEIITIYYFYNKYINKISRDAKQVNNNISIPI